MLNSRFTMAQRAFFEETRERTFLRVRRGEVGLQRVHYLREIAAGTSPTRASPAYIRPESPPERQQLAPLAVGGRAAALDHGDFYEALLMVDVKENPPIADPAAKGGTLVF